MSSSSVSDFGQNEWLVEEMYERFKADPNSVDPSWHEFLSKYTPGAAEVSLSLIHIPSPRDQRGSRMPS
ncbi:hypothetical protein LB823_23490, partial [Tsukamurella sp. M9C]|uniref:2-oxoglutarate dehydrogenase E1 subunit family protein n=1 Tax=Tsukamurella sp. M9C TaxID=2877520 RepID=UPI001CCDD9D2